MLCLMYSSVNGKSLVPEITSYYSYTIDLAPKPDIECVSVLTTLMYLYPR
jgi:hypothetical protein